MHALLLLLGTAFAADGNGRASLFLPGAAPTGDSTAEVALGTGVAVPTDVDTGALLDPEWSSSADLLWSPGDRFALETQALFGERHLLSLTSARHVVARGERWSFAPWAGALLLGPAPDTEWDLLPMVGVAVDYRAPRWGFDASWPAVTARIALETDEVLFMPGLPEAGLSWHPGDHTMLRGGLAFYMPSFRWRHELGGFFYEIDVAAFGGGTYQARGGYRF